MTYLCNNLGICGRTRGHAGGCVVNHALVKCLDLANCVLCKERSAARRGMWAERYGITTESLEQSRIAPEARQNARRSAAGCINCPICDHANHDRTRTMELTKACTVLYWLGLALAPKVQRPPTRSSKAKPEHRAPDVR